MKPKDDATKNDLNPEEETEETLPEESTLEEKEGLSPIKKKPLAGTAEGDDEAPLTLDNDDDDDDEDGDSSAYEECGKNGRKEEIY
jgi:hypothetical protein